MNTDQLIDQLVKEAGPVARLQSPARRAGWWALVALICVTLGVAYFGLRYDAADAWFTTGMLVRIVLLAATMWLAVVTAFRLSVPGHDLRAWSRWWPLGALGLLVTVVGAEVVAAAIFGEIGPAFRSWSCVRKVVFVGAGPAVLAIALIQRGAALEPRWALLLGVLAAGAAGALTSEIACSIRAPLHIFLWHVLPVAASAALGALLGAFFWQPPGKREK